MNSLHTLNTRGAEQVSYTDNRLEGPIFSRTNTTNRTITIEQNDDHGAVVGINVLDIVNPTTTAMYYVIDVSSLSGTTVTWTTVPAGCVTSNPSTGVYQITGIDTGAIWKQVRSPTIDIPPTFTGTFTYTSTLHYVDPTIGTNQTKSWTVTVTVTDVLVLTTPVEQFFVAGETQAITAPTIQTDKLGTYTITVTPSTTADITSMQATIADPDNVTSFNGTSKVFTIAGTREQVGTFLAAFSVTFDSAATNNTFTYALTCTNTDVPSDSETQTVTEAVYWFPPGAAEYGSGIASTLANPGRIQNLTDLDELYTIEITPTNASQISTLAFQDIDFFTRDPADTVPNQSSNYLYTNWSSDISDGGRLAIGMRTNPDVAIDEGEINIYQYDKTANTLTHIETLILPSTFEPNVLDVNISRDGNVLLCGDYPSDCARYVWNGSTFGTPTAQGKYARASDQSSDGSVAVLSNHDTGTATASLEVNLYYDSGSGHALQQTISNPDTAKGYGFGTDIAVSGDGNYVAVADTIYSNLSSFPYGYEGRVYIYERTGGGNLTLQHTITGAQYEALGQAIELNSDGSQLYITAPGYNTSQAPHTGKIYIYSRSGSTWTEDTSAGSPLTHPQVESLRFSGVDWADFQTIYPYIEIKIGKNDDILHVPCDGGLTVAIYKKIAGVWQVMDVIYKYRASALSSGDSIYDYTMFHSDGNDIFWNRRDYGQIGTWNGTVLTASNLERFIINKAINGIVLTSTPTTDDIELTYQITLEDTSTHSSTQTVTHNEGIA